MTGEGVRWSGQDTTTDDVECITLGADLSLDETAWERIRESHNRLTRYQGEQRLIYGVTTGYGPLANTIVGSDHSEALQRNLVAHLSAGVGDPLSREQTRATMAARVSALSRGASGIAPAALNQLLTCLNANALPVVPAMGTVGASGDLTPLAHIAGALMGKGWIRHGDGDPEPAAAVLERLGLAPLEPGGKDAIALVNGTSAMTGIAALNDRLADRALRWSTLITVAHAQALRGRREAWHSAFGNLRPHPGQQKLHRWLGILDEAPPDAMTDEGQVATDALQQLSAPIQDPYSLRCAPQLLGAVADQVDWHTQIVTTELNSVTDNPILPETLDQALHGGNFYGQHVALASDALANAVITLAVHAERRIARLANPRLNQDLPAFLTGSETGLHSGFMGAQVTASALLAEMRTQATPASIQSIPTNGDNQDVVTMGTIGARRTHHLLALLYRILAIDALMAVQALELRAEPHLRSEATAQMMAWVRARSPSLTSDRALSEDIEKTAEAMRSPWMVPADLELSHQAD
ncbi:histidine ammonia-lyase [Halovibrio salipaludis]|uniref:Histidine ammonia-lyase n=1 Tax=Halovibrio salipaludis TaxID=2032626 RepID=A0A2A2F8Y1_9GAMM|nr:aromatic amino acid ammonia-lyase [Halovibrio salipaludis]PAU81117.1 histidine ammonia-lyase [Halovibrio salipaludis]